jgi:hypothetical protein
MKTRELQGAFPSPSMPAGSSGPLVSMLACSLMLLVMLTACSPPALAQSVSGEPALPPKSQCAVTVSYPQGRPDLVGIEFPGGDCADEDIALAVALAAILKSTVQPRCPEQKPPARLHCHDGEKR